MCFSRYLNASSECLALSPEIDPEVDFDSRRAVYFRQMRYGLFVSPSQLFLLNSTDVVPIQIRMALLASVMG